ALSRVVDAGAMTAGSAAHEDARPAGPHGGRHRAPAGRVWPATAPVVIGLVWVPLRSPGGPRRGASWRCPRAPRRRHVHREFRPAKPARIRMDRDPVVRPRAPASI